MTTTSGARYEIRVDGHLDDHWSARLGGLAITRSNGGTSTLAGPVADQAQLHGVLAGLRDLGVTLLDLHAAAAPPAVPPPALPHPLHTDRLTLRAATPADADPTWRFRQDAAVNEWLTGCPDTLAGYRELFTDPGRLATTVVVQLGHGPDGQVVADLMLRREDAWAQLDVADGARGAQAELGWVLDPAHEGHGYATEAVRELLRHCFADLGVRRVHANSFLDNDASWRLMERVGMRRELHAVRESLHRSGRWLDVVGYALLADEWSPA
ncbi:GNAT family N-acetyltransferase [Nocardioides taihuensis]|uniref:GNAT family N-acetyltransferase n=1 Tax=Nocardioides taihuensis TaxID=1835606 RepID=A0ABW0BD96_9ACTN